MSKKNSSILAPSFIPATAVLELTYKCNNKCLYCSCPWEAKNKYKKRKELSLKEWKEVIDKITEMGALNIAFSGGEPLLNKDINRILEYASKKKSPYIETKDNSLVKKLKPPKLYLLSNGILMNDEILELCIKHKIHLSLSLPGIKTYKIHTKNGRAENVLELFKKAKNKRIDTTANITVTKKNLFELYEIIGNALIAGAGSILLNRFLPGGRGLKYEKELSLNKEEINIMLDTAEEVLKTSNRHGSVGTELPLCVINDIGKYKYLKVSTTCSAAKDFFVIGPSGFIRTCNHSPVELYHYSQIEKVKDHAYWKKFIFKDYKPCMCEDCKFLYDCDAGCREAAGICNGSIDANDPVFDTGGSPS